MAEKTHKSKESARTSKEKNTKKTESSASSPKTTKARKSKSSASTSKARKKETAPAEKSEKALETKLLSLASKPKILIALVLACLIFALGFGAGRAWEQSQQPTLDPSTIKTQVAECSDLSTAELTYNGLISYSEGHIPYLSKKAFSMTYTAHVRAGVDLTQAKVTVNGKSIEVVLPKATIQSSAIDPQSIQFHDQSFALLNWFSNEDTVKAMQSAQADVEANADKTSLLETASENATVAVEGLLAPFADQGYNVSIKVES